MGDMILIRIFLFKKKGYVGDKRPIYMKWRRNAVERKGEIGLVGRDARYGPPKVKTTTGSTWWWEPQGRAVQLT